MEFTNNLKLPLLVPNQSGKEFTHNEALIIIDNMLHSAILAVANEPPPEPSVGDRYLVGESPTGEFSNRENKLAFYDNGWRFVDPFPGQLLWNRALSKLYVSSGAGTWSEAVVDTSTGEETAFDSNFSFTDPQSGDIVIYDGDRFVNDATALAGIATTDLANITATAKSSVCGLSMPSSRTLSLTVGASGSIFTAPADGYLAISSRANIDGAQGKLENIVNWLSIRWSIANINHYFAGYLPCSKGQTVQYSYSYQDITNLKFHYSNGN